MRVIRFTPDQMTKLHGHIKSIHGEEKKHCDASSEKEKQHCDATFIRIMV
jgi:hypothetical protein